MAVEKFTLSELYQDENNRVTADENNPMGKETLMMVSEKGDDDSYRTKVMNYQTLYSSLCASMNIGEIQENVTNIITNQDEIGISGEYPCFFEMYSSYHFNSKSDSEDFYMSPISNDTGEIKGLFGKTIGADKLKEKVGYHTGKMGVSEITATIIHNEYTDEGEFTKTVLLTHNTPYLDALKCLKPFKIFKNEHPDPQQVTVVVAANSVCGVYIDHAVNSDDTHKWQRTLAFCHNPTNREGCSSVFKLIITPGSRFGICGEEAFFTETRATVQISLTNTKGHLAKQEKLLQFQGGQYSNTIVFEKQGTQEYEPKTYHIFGPIFTNVATTFGCINLQACIDYNSSSTDDDWIDIASKIYNSTAGTYVDFGNVYVKENTAFRYYLTNKNIKSYGTSKIGNTSYINGSLYFDKVTLTSDETEPTIASPLIMNFKSNGTHKADQYKNIQCKLNDGRSESMEIQTILEKSGKTIARKITSKPSKTLQDFRYYNSNTDGDDGFYTLSVDSEELDMINPMMFYVSNPTTNSTNEFKQSNYDGTNSGIFKIDGTHANCPITDIPDKCFFDCTDLEEVKFNNNLQSFGEQAFNKCINLKSISAPGIKRISKSCIGNCTNLSAFNIDSDGFSTIPNDAILSNHAFVNPGIKKLKIGPSSEKTWVADSLNKLNLDDLIMTYDLTSGPALAFYTSTIKNLSIDLERSSSNNTYLPLLNTDCTINNLSVYGTSQPTLSAQLSKYKTQHAYLKDIGTLRYGAYQSSTTLTSLESENTNIAPYFCSGCLTLKNVKVNNDEQNIGSFAFNGCTSLEKAELTCKTIDNSAFNGCKKLTNLTLSNTESIGSNAFASCTSLTSLTLPSTLKKIDIKAFNGCTSLKGENIPEFGDINLSSIEYIGNDSAFRNTNIHTVLIGSGLTSTTLDNYTFAGCKSITNIKFMDADCNDTYKKIFKLITGKDVTETTCFKGTKMTSNICNGVTTKVVKVYCNCDSFRDKPSTEVEFATIDGTTIIIQKDITLT